MEIDEEHYRVLLHVENHRSVRAAEADQGMERPETTLTL